MRVAAFVLATAPPCASPGCRVLAMRCALSHYLLQLSADPRSPVLFRCTPSAGGRGGLEAVAGLVPTLFLVKDAMLQVWPCWAGLVWRLHPHPRCINRMASVLASTLLERNASAEQWVVALC